MKCVHARQPPASGSGAAAVMQLISNPTSAQHILHDGENVPFYGMALWIPSTQILWLCCYCIELTRVAAVYSGAPLRPVSPYVN